MLTLVEREKLHQLLMHDLAIKALQRDYDKLSHLKLSSLYESATDVALHRITEQFKQIKNELAHRKIRILSWEQINEHFTQVTIANSGEDMTLDYAKKAIESNVHEIIQAAWP